MQSTLCKTTKTVFIEVTIENRRCRPIIILTVHSMPLFCLQIQMQPTVDETRDTHIKRFICNLIISSLTPSLKCKSLDPCPKSELLISTYIYLYFVGTMVNAANSITSIVKPVWTLLGVRPNRGTRHTLLCAVAPPAC